MEGGRRPYKVETICDSIEDMLLQCLNLIHDRIVTAWVEWQ